jgi:RNA polymerase sigma factor (sigma-70 family)
LGILLQRYTLLLFGVCMKYLKNESEAKDGVQQIFLKTIGELQKYRVEYFKSWVYMVAKNHCLMQLRNKQGKYTTEISERLNMADTPETGPDPIQKEMTLENMNSAIEELNEEQKQCVTLFYLQKQSYQQICDATGFTYMQVKSFIQNGKRNLRILIEEKMNNSR